MDSVIYLRILVVGIVLSMLIFMVNPISGYNGVQNIITTINGDGSVFVEMNVTVGSGLNYIILPVKPVPETIKVYEYGEGIVPIYLNMTLIIPVEKAGVVDIRYVANITAVGGKAFFDVGNASVILKVMKGVILLSLPDNISELHTEDSVLVLCFTGPAEISYTLSESPASENVSNVSPIFPWQYILLGLMVIIVVVAVYLFIRRRPRDLDPVDKDILDILRKKGGKAIQSELMTELHIPKTTLWRHVKRLEALEYVEVEKIGRVNIVKLRRG